MSRSVKQEQIRELEIDVFIFSLGKTASGGYKSESEKTTAEAFEEQANRLKTENAVESAAKSKPL